MKFNSNLFRIAFALSMWSATVLLGLRLAGLFEDDGQRVLQMRQDLCEVVAVSCSQHATRGDEHAIRVALEALVRRHHDVQSAACVRDGQNLAVVGPHTELWRTDENGKSTVNSIYVPVLEGDEKWGEVEVCFRPLLPRGLLGFASLPSVKVTLAATLLNLVGFLVWLRRCMQPMDPSAVVPQRVRTTLDTMAEAVVVLDRKERIVTANRAFYRIVDEPSETMIGKEVGSLPWVNSEFNLDSLKNQEECTRVRLKVNGEEISFIGRASEVADDNGVTYGTLLSLADVTALEDARSKIEKKNKELEYLATRDSLTGCLNRRSFFDIFENQWQHSVETGRPIGCVMVDIDHFKSINDTHGHAMGDEVLRKVSGVLLDAVRGGDYVCRYGGEEFCILLAGSTLEEIEIAAERYRREVENLDLEIRKVTASLGCSARRLGADDKEAMLEQADKALYAAKEGGRNQVVRFDQISIKEEQPADAEYVLSS